MNTKSLSKNYYTPNCFILLILYFIHLYTNFNIFSVLYPLSKSSKHETTVKWNTVNPEFHEQFVYLTSHSELPKQSLHLTVWDRGKGKPDEYIGKHTEKKINLNNTLIRHMLIPP